MDAALKAGFVVDVLQEIGFDVDDGAQLLRAVEPGFRHVALADQELHIGEKRLEPRGRHAAGALVHGEVPEALEPAPRGAVEDLVQGARLRIDHDQRSRHPFLPPQFKDLYRFRAIDLSSPARGP